MSSVCTVSQDTGLLKGSSLLPAPHHLVVGAVIITCCMYYAGTPISVLDSGLMYTAVENLCK